MSALEYPEAGPSKPRTPPATPPPKGRRRSWFGLVASPFSAGSSPRDSTATATASRRNSSAVAVDAGAELELADRSGGTGTTAESLDKGSERRTSNSGTEPEETDILDIDGRVETPSSEKKKNAKKKRSGDAEELGEALRLDDLGLRRREPLEDNRPPDPPDPSIAAATALAPPISSPQLSKKPPIPSPRTSSLTIPSIRVPSEKSTPPLPTDRPLPALPPGSPANTTPKAANIVVTPSSPQAEMRPPHMRRASASMSDLRTERTKAGPALESGREESRGSSQTRSHKMMSRKSSLIGLGLPRGIWAGNDDPPPVPSKPQAVSAPFPSSRSTSPVPKISFAEPDDEAGRGRTARGAQKDNTKRARSLSGIFSKTSVSSQDGSSQAGSEADPKAGVAPIAGDRDAGPEPAEAVQGEPGKIAGVLEWLGMRKAGKRRASESRTVPLLPVGDAEGVEPSERTGVGDTVAKGEQIAQGLNSQAPQQEPTTDPGTIRPRNFNRPEIRNASSSMTVLPDSNRTVSASSLLSDVNPSAGTRTPVPIPILAIRPAASTPSTPSGPASPDFFNAGSSSYVSSPTSTHEDFFFTPPGAPWIDGSEQSSHRASPLSRSVDVQSDPESGTKASGTSRRDGRNRSQSDAPMRGIQSGTSHAESEGTVTSAHRPHSHRAQTLTSSPRPKLGSRSNSGNSAIIEKMKGVFAKSSARNRSRSRSLLPSETSAQGSPDEFGGLATSGDLNGERAGAASVNPSMTTRSTAAVKTTPARSPNASLLGLYHGGSHVILDDADLRTTDKAELGTGRTLTPASSNPSISATPLVDLNRDLPSGSKATGLRRSRASTVSFASSAPQASFLTPPSPSLAPSVPAVPAASTPPRRRPSAIQRFSSGLLGSSAPSSPKGSLFPLPPRSSGSTFSSSVGADDTMSTSTAGTAATSHYASPHASPRPSTGSFGVRSDLGTKIHTQPEEGESSAEWLQRVIGLVGPSHIAGVLASSGDEFHTEALNLYMAQFNFERNALDIALRRLLLQMSLPKETQQIDRVIEAFATRYEACEPDLFGSKDNTYVLAFSMMMLHTDAFNRNNKNKMSKADYVRNTRMDGVSSTTLEAFYDNITYTPFVYTESAGPHLAEVASPVQSARMSGRSRSSSDAVPSSYTTKQRTSSSTVVSPGSPASFGTSTYLASNGPKTAVTPLTLPASVPGKIDVYGMISSNTLASLRVDLEYAIPPRSPFSCSGTLSALDMDALQSSYVGAQILKVGGSPSKRRSAMARKEGATPSSAGQTRSAESDNEGEVSLRVTKVGLLSRKDDAADSATRKTSRKWRSWGVVLTGSQLLFFKDPVWALTLLEQLRGSGRSAVGDAGSRSGQANVPRVARFVPDEVFPMKDAVAVFDRKLAGEPYTFRFHLAHRAYLIQASDEKEMNEWIHLINYSAAFKTAGIRMRASGLKRDQALLAGAAAATSLKREVRAINAAGPDVTLGKKTFGGTGAGTKSEAAASWAEETERSLQSLARPSTPTTAGDARRSTTLAETKKSLETGTPSSPRRSGESTGTAADTISTGTPSRSEASLSPVSGKNVFATLENAGSLVKDDGEQLGEVFSAVKAELAAHTGVVTVEGTNLPKPNGVAQSSNVARTKPSVRVRISSSQAVRSSSIQAVIRDFEAKRRFAKAQLDGHLTQARNLAILTPFQKTTRDRIASAVQPLANRVRAERLLIAKYSTWIAVLRYDLEREERDWTRNREVALQAAENTLRGSSPIGSKRLLGQGDEARTGTQAEDAGISHTGTGAEDQEEEEVLQDLRRHDRENEYDGGHDSEGTATSTSLGSTSNELPLLIRRTQPSGNALQTSEAPTASDAASRPGMRRHVSASSAVLGSFL